MTTQTLNDLANQGFRCDGCGCQTSRVFDNDQCAVCHFSYLQHRETRINTARELLMQAVRATLGQGVHPDDARAIIERELSDPPDLSYQHLAEITEQLEAMRAAMAEAVA